ncbi:hypothetical protein N2152v2_003761 [Parachlorella kessleri]
MDPPCQDLLRKAVVSLEKKLQERAQQLAEALKERDALLQEQERWRRDHTQLAQANTDLEQLQQDSDAKGAKLRRLRQQVEDLDGAGSRLQARVSELEATNARLAGQLEQWKADREAAEVGCIRAVSQQQVQAATVQQLEAANEALRLDLHGHSAKLQQAYEREAQLLTEIGRLKEDHRKKAAEPHTVSPPPVKEEVKPSCNNEKLENLHRDLFMAAAQHLLKQFTAKVAQEEDRAATLCTRLQEAESQFVHLASQNQSLQSRLNDMTSQCRLEEQTARKLLASNMHLHENMLHLMEQAAASVAANAQSKAPARTGPMPDPSPTASRGWLGSRQGCSPGDAAAAVLAGPGCGTAGPLGRCQHGDTARTAAVDAALAISTEYKELHDYYKAVVAEVRRVGSCLTVAYGQAQKQQLAKQHSELQKELWDVAEQLETKVSQLTALKHAGLL